MASWTRSEVARTIDHTLLRPEATRLEVVELCEQAAGMGVAAVCVSPNVLPLPVGALPAGIGLAAVVGFPSGAHLTEVKAVEAERALADGATEVDMVIDLGLAKAGDWSGVEQDIAGVRKASAVGVLKVILESGVLSPDELRQACRVAEAAGADFVKTSTGFHPSGGATVEAVRLMADAVGGRLGVKASGGIRTADGAVAMLYAGATRLGCSATEAILSQLDD